MFTGHLLLALLWILYCAIHSLLADSGVKKKLQQRMGRFGRYYRLLYTLLAFISLVLVIYYQVSLSTIKLFSQNLLTSLAGLLLAIPGLVLMIYCIKKYFLTLSGLRTLYMEQPGDVLMVTGIHRYVRHPLYLGTFAFIWGLFVLVPLLSLLVAVTIITVYTLIAIRLEEEKLIMEFGEDYKRYRKNVPALFPRPRLKSHG